jgi:hypothetical protein
MLMGGANTSTSDRARNIGEEQLVVGLIRGHVDVHQTAPGEEAQAYCDEDAQLDPCHRLWDKRNNEQLQQADPGQNRSVRHCSRALVPDIAVTRRLNSAARSRPKYWRGANPKFLRYRRRRLTAEMSVVNSIAAHLASAAADHNDSRATALKNSRDRYQAAVQAQRDLVSVFNL